MTQQYIAEGVRTCQVHTSTGPPRPRSCMRKAAVRHAGWAADAGVHVWPSPITVAILAQGTSWAVAVTQAFWDAVSIPLPRVCTVLCVCVCVSAVDATHTEAGLTGMHKGAGATPPPMFLTLLEVARKLTPSKEILLWMTPSEAPKALQASECSELLDPMRASCWIFAQH